MQSKHIYGFFFLLTLIIMQSCATSYKYSYEEEDSPVLKGDFRNQNEIEEELTNSIKVVSFNIEFA